MAEYLLTGVDLSLLFIVFVSRNFVSGICKLKLKNLKKNLKTIFLFRKPRFFSPGCFRLRR